MAGFFGRDRRGSSSFNLQTCGRYRRSKKRGKKSKERAVVVIVVVAVVVGGVIVILVLRKQQLPTRKKFQFSESKAGTGKAPPKQQGSESGSSEESSASFSSSSPSPTQSKPNRKPNLDFKTGCRRRRRRRRRRTRPKPESINRKRTIIPFLPWIPKSVFSTIPRTPSTPSTAIWRRIKYTITSATTTRTTTTSQETLLLAFLLSDERICEFARKNGRINSKSPNHFFKIGWIKEHRRRRDCGGSRRPHCPVHRPQRPAQQSMHSKGAERPTRSSFCPYCNPIL